MKVLVVNTGSTSVKYQLYEMDTEAQLAAGKIERIGSGDTPDADAAMKRILGELMRADGPIARVEDISAVGHRVVHGGERLVRPVVVDDEVLATIADCSKYAPLHNPPALVGIAAARAALPAAQHVAVFDTAFHAELPPHAFQYALPNELYLERGIRRYGFHGPSHQYMALAAAAHLGTDLARLKLVTCHLGGGASISAIEGGRSVDTSMGMTPLEGLVMGTRAGDLDPAIPLLLARGGMPAEAIDALFNKRSGLAGLSGIASGDYRDIEAAAEAGDVRARLAIDVFVHRLRKYIGAYAAVLGGADAIVFTGGIGENSARMRTAVCDGLLFMGVALDVDANAKAAPALLGGIVDVAAARAPTRVLVVATEEEKMIAREVVRCVSGPSAAIDGLRGRPIPVGVSVRHVHLSRAHCDALFGAGYELTVRREVTQKGQYVTRETVDLVGPKGELRGVAIINPLRERTQVEIAKTDAFALGVRPPIRESGRLEGTPGLRLRGPAGEVELSEGVILALRHVHMSPSDAQRFGVGDKDVIQVAVAGDREMTLGDVLVRVREDFVLDMHIDTDEANAAGLDNDSVVAFARVQERRSSRA
ncbi:MAG TPA: acetate/propionate family kinase [Nannocystaceae bacterium]|nr:acetate/propionate family kinase [Nannocystaceae bacterium]